MLITLAFIFVFAWSASVIFAADHHGRTVSRIYRVATLVGVVGVMLVLPGLLVGSYGLPSGWSIHWLGVVAWLGEVGFALIAAGFATWLMLDIAFVWRERRRILPFVFRR